MSPNVSSDSGWLGVFRSGICGSVGGSSACALAERPRSRTDQAVGYHTANRAVMLGVASG